MVATDKPGYRVIGTRPIRHDGTDKVTGRAGYGADFSAAGMLYGRVLRSPHAHARIKSIDTSKAEALEGVRAVITNADFPQPDDSKIDIGEGATPAHAGSSTTCSRARRSSTSAKPSRRSRPPTRTAPRTRST